jgi:mannan endo-1,4-beta-mannosidase
VTQPPPDTAGRDNIRATRVRMYVALVTCAVVLGAAVVLAVTWPRTHAQLAQPKDPVRYLGVYEPDAPGSYAGIDEFAHAIGTQPNLVSYYSAWGDTFQAGFAASAATHGAMTVVQIDPENIPLASIVAGQYDTYLRSYAGAVKAFGAQVILSFGHEMNGNWYTWAYQHTPAAVFVAAWRHIVDVFRAAGARNVTWLWTVNIIDWRIPIPNPSQWWPGSSYVNWVGIDGYYYNSTWKFAPLFGPTIVAVRALTRDPILITETGAAATANQPAKIADLFAGARTYGLLGFAWFDSENWRINSPQAFAAFRREAKAFMGSRAKPAS